MNIFTDIQTIKRSLLAIQQDVEIISGKLDLLIDLQREANGYLKTIADNFQIVGITVKPGQPEPKK